jgi:hypothetical protein
MERRCTDMHHVMFKTIRNTFQRAMVQTCDLFARLRSWLSSSRRVDRPNVTPSPTELWSCVFVIGL